MLNSQLAKMKEYLEDFLSIARKVRDNIEQNPDELEYADLVAIQKRLDDIFDLLLKDNETDNPALGVEEQSSSLIQPTSPPLLQSLQGDKRIHLAIIDDEPSILHIFQEFFNDKPFDVHYLDSGLKLFPLIKQGVPFDVIVSDVRMPGLDGVELLKEIKNSPRHKTEIILMSAYRDVNVLMEAINLGAFSFIFKPLNFDYIINQIYKAFHYRNLQEDEQIIENRIQTRYQDLTSRIQGDHNRLQNIFDSLTSLVLIIDKKFNIINSNYHRLETLPLKQGKNASTLCELINCSVCEQCPFLKTIEQLDQQSDIHCQVTLRRKEDEQLYYLFLGVRVFDSAKKTYVLIIDDITHQKEMELRILHNDRLISLGRLAMSIAHEINQPLNGINAIVQGHQFRLQRGQDIPVKRLDQDYKLIIDQIRNITSIIDQLRLFGRTYKHISTEKIELKELIHKTLILINYNLKQQRIELIIDLSKETINFIANAFQIQQVIINLLHNAAESIEEKMRKFEQFKTPQIKLSLYKDDRFIHLTVNDNGMGIPLEDRYRIFDPFFTTKEAQGGTGLGLSISYGIIKSYNGDIEVNSDYTHYATFHIKLPQMREE